MIDIKSRLGLLAVSAIAWALVPSAHAQPVNDPALRGAIDIHAHLDPDGFGPGHNGRAMDTLDLARLAKEAGMRGFVIKMHYDQSADDAYTVRKLYPDLEAEYVNRVAESLRQRGETSAAEAEVRRIALKNKAGRGDLARQQARDSILRAIKTQPLPEQIRADNSVVDQYGANAGIGFFDEIVAGFVTHLLQQSQKAEAQRAIDRARRVQNVQPNSQLAAEFDQLAARVRQAK